MSTHYQTRGAKKNREFSNDRHIVLNFAHCNDTSIHYLIGQIVSMLLTCVCIFILRSLFFFALFCQDMENCFSVVKHNLIGRVQQNLIDLRLLGRLIGGRAMISSSPTRVNSIPLYIESWYDLMDDCCWGIPLARIHLPSSQPTQALV